MVVLVVKKKKKKTCLPMQGDIRNRAWSLGWEDPLEEGIATHSSILAWRIPWTEEPGGLQSIGSQSQTQLSTHACMENMVNTDWIFDDF